MPKHSDFIRSIMITKDDLLEGKDEKEQDLILKDYSPFLINKQLSKHLEYLFQVNWTNQKLRSSITNTSTGEFVSVPVMSKKTHYHFLLHSTPVKTG